MDRVTAIGVAAAGEAEAEVGVAGDGVVEAEEDFPAVEEEVAEEAQVVDGNSA